jgi:hypothetical protein
VSGRGGTNGSGGLPLILPGVIVGFLVCRRSRPGARSRSKRRRLQ